MKPWLWLPTKLAHDASPAALKALELALRCAGRSHPPEWSPLEWRGIRFPNRLGVAGGVDKNGSAASAWQALGAGFVEVGTVTPQKQGPNPGSIMARDLPARALWNKMGFPSAGAAKVARRLQGLERPHRSPIFVNVGKNRATPNELAGRDYASCIRALYGAADAFVINVSSPNTMGLRDLLNPVYLRELLRQTTAARDEAHEAMGFSKSDDPTPVLIKLSPDMDADGLEAAVDAAIDRGLDGFVATNTTVAREAGSPFPQEGGVSGAPLAERAKQALRDLLRALGDRRKGRLIVSVGGIMSAEDAFERLRMGADLTQVYSALVFEGPGFFRSVARAAAVGWPMHASPSSRPKTV